MQTGNSAIAVGVITALSMLSIHMSNPNRKWGVNASTGMGLTDLCSIKAGEGQLPSPYNSLDSLRSHVLQQDKISFPSKYCGSCNGQIPRQLHPQQCPCTNWHASTELDKHVARPCGPRFCNSRKLHCKVISNI